MRRKSWYPRKKQRQRWRVKLGIRERMILLWLWEWDDSSERRVVWLFAKHLKANIQKLLDTGVVWKPKLMAMSDLPPGNLNRVWLPKGRASVSRALHGLARRGMVELIPYPNSKRTHLVKFTKRGVEEGKRILSPSNMLTHDPDR